MEKNFLKEIKNTPKTEFIPLFEGNGAPRYCRFCGKPLRVSYPDGYKFREFSISVEECSCEAAKVAQKHNERAFDLTTKVEPKAENDGKVEVKEAKAKVARSETAVQKGPMTFEEIVRLFKREGLYISHQASEPELTIDGFIDDSLVDNMHQKVLFVDSNTKFQTRIWNLTVNFIVDNQTPNPCRKVVEALALSPNCFNGIVVSDAKKARELLEARF